MFKVASSPPEARPLDVDACLRIPLSSPVVVPRPVVAAPTDTRHAAAALLASVWPTTGRHLAQMALMGALVRGGWSDAEILTFVDGRFDSSMPGPAHRAQTLATTRATSKPTGFQRLKDHIPGAVVDAARELMGLSDHIELPPGFMDHVAHAPAPPVPALRGWPSAADRARRLGGSCTRLPTGFATLDTCTRGGLPLGKVAVFGGAPGAAKTTTAIDMGYRWARCGVYVGILAADEDASGLLVRFGQLAGFPRASLEDGDAATREAFAKHIDTLSILLADADEEYVSVEDISDELRRRANGSPSVLIVDSIQTVRAKGTQDAPPRERINAVMVALKRAAKVDGHLVIATCELARGAYRSRDAADHINDLAAFKESGDVEYGAALLLVLRSRPDTTNEYDVSMPKNRLGAKSQFALRLDFNRASLSEISAAPDPKELLRSQILYLFTGQHHALLFKNQIVEMVGGRKQKVLNAIGELLDEKKLIESSNGIRLPRAGDPS